MSDSGNASLNPDSNALSTTDASVGQPVEPLSEPQPFVHLHVHSHYSFLTSTIKVDELVEQVKKFNQPAVALTDTNNIFGAIDFYFKCKEHGIKPIIGCDLLYVPDATSKTIYSLVVLCKDLTGYRNLSHILTHAYVEGAKQPSRFPNSDFAKGLVDLETLSRHKEGLIVLSSGLRGEVAQHLLQGQDDSAIQTIQTFKSLFNEDYYLEIVDNGITEQRSINQRLLELGDRLGVEIVGTSESGYLHPDIAEAQEVLQCIPLGRNLDFGRPPSLVPKEFYPKPSKTMGDRLAAYGRAYENTLKIAEKCNLSFKFKDDQGRAIYHLPQFRPEGISKTDVFDGIQYFKEQSRLGLEKRFTEPEFAGPDGKKHSPLWPDLEQQYRERLETELGMIEKTGFSGYFLIVSDFIKWAKAHQIPVGPGRGSGAGSLVAYCLEITDIDPIQFKLLFERFINPERVSMPDFDVDFCQDRRPEVIEYVRHKYGVDNVAQIITFGKLQARAVIKDVGRVMGLSFAETDKITKALPDELNLKLSTAFAKEPALKEVIEADPKLKVLWEYALQLEGLYRNAGVHAAGVIITEEPIVNYCPLYVGKDGGAVTQFDKDFAEKIGLVKYDFLGLKTLTVIDNAVKFIRASSEGKDFDLKAISMSDPAVFALISSGNTNGVFQVESDGMKDLCKRIVPNSLEDLTAINALYRPGPLGSGMVDDFIERKHGRLKTEYDLPELEPILADTYGVILYQEQVMQTARDIAGYSLGQADMLRRAMGKKKPEEMAKQKEIFVAGAIKKGFDAQKAESLFDLMAKFAEYGFNKSHSAAYGMITYQTAFLKTHYPAEFMAALMTTEMSDTDKLAKYTADARAQGITVLPPDVNASVAGFSIEQHQGTKAVRFGLEAIKGVGGSAVEAILESREKSGPFESVVDFCKRVAMRKVNKKVLESLTLSGGFDSVFGDLNRATVHASIESLIEFGNHEQEKAELGQNSLFDDFKAEEVKLSRPMDQILKRESEYGLAKKLLLEKQVLGFFISGHPMQSWQNLTREWLGASTEKLKTMVETFKPVAYGQKRREVKFAGVVTEFKEITTKKGSKMAFFRVEDLDGSVEVIAFPDFYSNNADALKAFSVTPEPVVVQGEYDVKEGEPKVLANQIVRLEEALNGRASQVMISFDPDQISVEKLREFQHFVLNHRGKSPLRVRLQSKHWRAELPLSDEFKVTGTPEFAAGVNKIFGGPVVQLLA